MIPIGALLKRAATLGSMQLVDRLCVQSPHACRVMFGGIPSSVATLVPSTPVLWVGAAGAGTANPHSWNQCSNEDATAPASAQQVILAQCVPLESLTL